MDDRALRAGGNDNQGSYIWLRYSTQFTSGGRTHTIEMGIPMPLGASAEEREQLLSEAEAGLSQLSSHVEQRVSQVMQRAQSSQPANASSLASATPRSATAPKPPAPARPASVPAPQTAAQPAQPLPAQASTRETSTAREEPAISQPRQSVGASMPLAPVSTGTTGNIPLREFLQYIKENFDLDPKQAMTLLKVKSLNDINRREALEQLQHIVRQEGISSSPATSTESSRSTNTTSPSRATSNDTPPLVAPSGPTPIIVGRVRSVNDELPQEPVMEMVREKQPIYIFDEEVGPDDEEELDDLDELDLPRELTPQEQTRARTLLSKLRESRGATSASPNRLQVLHNVAGSQLDTEQLQTLIEGVWGATSQKKLKVDQAEALISWAKEDDFVGEAEAVLALLEEEFYARGNR